MPKKTGSVGTFWIAIKFAYQKELLCFSVDTNDIQEIMFDFIVNDEAEVEVFCKELKLDANLYRFWWKCATILVF